MNLSLRDMSEIAPDEIIAAVPDRMGVYALSFGDGRAIASRLGFEEGAQPLIECGSFAHLYTGESIGVRSRIVSHLAGDIRASNLRKTLLAIQVDADVLDPGLKFRTLPDAENWLTDWLAKRAMVSFKCCPFARDAEAEILATTASPLNLKGKPRTPLSQRLTEARMRLSELDWVQTGLARLPPARRYRR